MSFQLQLKLDLKKLYNKLCPECKKKLLSVLKESISDDLILAAIGISGETTQKQTKRKTRTAVAEAIPPPEEE